TTGSLFLGDGTTLAVTSTDSFAAARSLFLGSVPGPARATIDVAANQTFTVAAVVANNTGVVGTLVKTGAGTLALTRPDNTYTGGTVVRAGTLQAAADGSLGPIAAPVTVEPAGTLTFGSTTTVRSYTLLGGSLGVAAGQTLTFSGATVAGGF